MTLEYQEGQTAYWEGEGIETNPYRAFNDQERYLEWKAGWEAAWLEDREN